MLYVRIHTSRGYGTGLFRVIKETPREYVVQPDDGGDPFSIYIVHTYQDLISKRRTQESKREEARKIGNKR